MYRIKILLVTILLCLAGALPAHVELVYPQGGEVFSSGEIVTIEWNILITHNTLNWDLYYSTDAGNSWEVLEKDIPYENLTYEWTVPNDSTSGARILVVQDNEGTDYSDQSDDFIIAPTTGISENKSNRVFLYPNPATSNLKVESTEVMEQIRIYDPTGRLILQSKPGERNAGFTLGNIPNGLYLVKIKTTDSYFIQKLVVK